VAAGVEIRILGGDMRNFPGRIGWLAAIAVVGISGLVRADNILATLDSVSGGSATLNYNGTNISGGVGYINWTGSASNAAAFSSPFSTFCIDLTEDIGYGSTYQYQVQPNISDAPKETNGDGSVVVGGPMGSTKAGDIQFLYNADFATAVGLGDLGYEAFQLAIWNIVYDSDDTVSSGTFYVADASGLDPGAIPLANLWLSLIPSGLSYDPADTFQVALLGLSTTDNGKLTPVPDAQDQIFYNPDDVFTGGGNPTPLPSAALGGAVLMSGMGLLSLRSRRVSKI
jgi:hypothetical protein